MAGRLTTGSRRFAFLAAHAGAAAGVWIFVVAPGLGLLEEQRRGIERTAAALEQASAVLARQDRLAASPVPADGDADRFLNGGSASLIEADLITRLRQAAEPSAVTFNSAAPLPPLSWSGRTLTGAQVEFTASTQQAAEILSRVEDGRSFLFIRRARLMAASDSESGSAGVLLEVYGAAR
jgi:hypothetical protein